MTTTSLAPTARLGPYEIESVLGVGGMGEVYLARDTRLARPVAIKILRPDGTGRDRREQFLVEARAISALTHPHIRGIYDVGCGNGLDFLVMEYIDGETLDRHLARRPMPLARAATCALQIAEALDAAHRHGIVHGDIKPANVMLTASGVKLLDFGIARLVATQQEPDSTTETDTGGVPGTVAYMAPEQLEGRQGDPRSDVFALGVVLYQMISGRRPFDGPTRARMIVSILEQEPPPLESPYEPVPAALDRLVMKCLAKDPNDRWQTARDLASELEWIAHAPAPRSGVAHPHGTRLPWAIAAVCAVVAIAAFARGATTTNPPAVTGAAVRFIADAPIGSVMAVAPGGFAASPDGRHLAFVASAGTGTRLLWLRTLDSFETRPLPGTDDAWDPFWSPDSRSIAFLAGGQLRRIDLDANRVQTISNVESTGYGTWSPKGIILMSLNGAQSGLVSINASGGAPARVPIPKALNDATIASPEFLPDGRHYVYHARMPNPDASGVYLASIDGGAHTRLLRSDSQASYADPGYLLYLRGNTFVAQRFDPQTLAVTGEPMPLPEAVSFVPGIDRAAFTISRSGVLAYRARVEQSELLWFDRAGRSIGSLAAPGPYINPALSPDGTRIAVTRGDPPAGTSDIWIIDTNRAMRQLTSTPAVENFPTWSPDGRRVLFMSDRNGTIGLYAKDVNAGAADPDELLLTVGRNAMPFDWSRDGRFVLYSAFNGRGMLGARFFLLPTTGSPAVPVQVRTERPTKEEGQGQISPDGRWLAYVSDVNGSPQVFVRPFPHGEGRWLISPAGGFEPKWRADGREIYYFASDQMLMAAQVTSGATFEVGEAHPLFRTNLMGTYLGSPYPNGRVRNEFAVTPDGQRFLINQPIGGSSAYAIRVVVNWPALLGRRADAATRTWVPGWLEHRTE